MEFNFRKIKIQISFSFFALLLLFIVTNKINIFLCTITSAIIHELSHIIFIYFFKMKIKSIKISIFGGNIKRCNGACGSYLQEAIINFSAPIINLIIGLMIYLISRKVKLFCSSNIVLGAFNILPFYTFDGGRGLKYFLNIIFEESLSEKIIKGFSVLITGLLMLFSMFLLFEYQNIILIIFPIYMILSLAFKT